MPLGLIELDDRSNLRRLGAAGSWAELDLGFGAQRPGWMDDMMMQLTERMQSVLRPTHKMVSDISCRLTTLEQKKNPESDEISLALLYKKTHTNKDGMWTSENARKNFEKIEALQLQHESEGKSYSEVEIFIEVLETKASYV
ncbi:hypothetical protein CJ030_MR5G003429 [Morella rubra]|uniref:Uncharacterized protein n=1 Tax=Morella rubra TaxID=262757 RepID=A0A6A1VKT9_9ROSI|nr:hypothetical protein CJ030_MR5G003429 [Morella rubra]